MKQELIAGIIVTIIGLVLVSVPASRIWQITDKWKSAGAEGPSKAFVIVTKVLGIVFAGVGIALIVIGL